MTRLAPIFNVLTLLAFFLIAKPLDIRGQVSKFAVPVAGYSIAGSGFSSVVPGSDIPSSLALAYRRWEAILMSPVPNYLSTESIAAKDLIALLAKIGIPTHLDASAYDAGLTENTMLELSLPEVSLLDKLLTVLDQHECTITYCRDHLKIISKDVAEIPKYFFSVIYDVSSYVTSGDSWFVTFLVSNVDTDRWEDLDGDQTMHMISAGGKTLLVVNGCWESHWKLRSFLSDISQFSRAKLSNWEGPSGYRAYYYYSPEQLSQQNATVAIGSTAVEIPGRKQKAGITVPGSSQLPGGGGMGGAGLGGMFSVPSTTVILPTSRR